MTQERIRPEFKSELSIKWGKILKDCNCD
jgi:hypothetical protein